MMDKNPNAKIKALKDSLVTIKNFTAKKVPKDLPEAKQMLVLIGEIASETIIAEAQAS